jgi:hypothetical protein
LIKSITINATIVLSQFLIFISNGTANVTTFSGSELLGRPTDNSVTINIVPDNTIEYYYEYGTSEGGPYSNSTTPVIATGGDPSEVTISGLIPDTRYYYRMVYDADGDVDDGDFEVRDEYKFHTQRASGKSFVFTIISDSHLNNFLGSNTALYNQACMNVAADTPDFHLDLGDTFFMDASSSGGAVSTDAMAEQRYLSQRPYMGHFSHSAAVYISPGNHEQEEGWNFDDTPASEAILGLRARKKYWPNPVPDGFYSGNTDLFPLTSPPTYAADIGDNQFREDYYAWEWGDALFIVFDPFQYTMENPYGNFAGEGNDDPASGDRWNWTLGQQQFNWLKSTLENSNAKFKFMFAHHMLGGTQNYVRGGAEPAHQFEWGGYNADGVTWGWTSKRPGWGDDPIHQLMINNHVSAFFHGHDHQYAYELRDGIVYQSLPAPSMSGNGFNLYDEADPYTEVVLPNSGHLRVTITETEATVDYINSSLGVSNGQISDSYTIVGNDNPLPVSLSFFSAQQVTTGVELKWITESQLNNAGFEIWRSENSRTDFSKIAGYQSHPQLSGEGSSSTQKEYIFIDQDIQPDRTYYYKLSDIDYSGLTTYHNTLAIRIQSSLPGNYRLYQNFPNPFNPETKIRFYIPGEEAGKKVNINIYNLSGQLITTLLDNYLLSGMHEISWRAQNNGQKLPSGIYLIELRTPTFRQVSKSLLLK